MAMIENVRAKGKDIAGEKRRKQILDVATSLFYRNGYERTGIRDIASAVGIKTGSLYYYFRGKEEILTEIMSSSLKAVISEGEDVVRHSPDPLKQLEMYVKTTVKLKLRFREAALLNTSELRSLPSNHREEVLSLRDEDQRILEGILARGMQQGVFAQADVKLLTYALFGLINRTTLWFSPQGRLTPDDIADGYYKFIRGGLMGTK